MNIAFSSAARTGVAAVGFLLVIGFLLLTEHRAHVISFLPWLIILACLFMHLFMHGGHGHHHGSGEHAHSHGAKQTQVGEGREVDE